MINEFGFIPDEELGFVTDKSSQTSKIDTSTTKGKITKAVLPIAGKLIQGTASKGKTGKAIIDFGGKMLGINEFMSGAGKRISQLVNPNIEKNLRLKMESGEITPQQYVQELTGASGIAPEDYKNLQKQMSGSAAQGLINTAGLLYNPASAATRIATATGLGVAEKAAQNVKESKPISQGLTTAGVINAATSGAGEVASGLVNKFLKEQPLAMYKKTFGASTGEVNKEIRALANEVQLPTGTAEWALNKGYKGKAKDIALQAVKDINLYDSNINNFVKQAPLPIKIDNRQTKLILENIKDGWTSASLIDKMDEADNLIAQLGDNKEIPTELAYNIKKFIDDSRSTASFHINSTMSQKQAAMKQTADAIRGQLKDKYGFMKQALDDESKAIEVYNAMLKKASKKPEGIATALLSTGPIQIAVDIAGGKGAATAINTINNLFGQVGFNTKTAQFLKRLAEGRVTKDGKEAMETLGKIFRTSPQMIKNAASIPFLPTENQGY